MNTLIAVIPARGGSVGVPGKNTQKIQGLSLVARSYLHSLALCPESLPLVTTDCQSIVDSVSQIAGGRAPSLKALPVGSIAEYSGFLLHHRPPALATSVARISDVLRQIQLSLSGEGVRYPLWVLMQPTSPFRSSDELLSLRLQLGHQGPEASLVSVRHVGDIHPTRMYRMNTKGHLKSLGYARNLEGANRQDLPKVYIRDGGFYVIGESLILRGKQFSSKPKSIVRTFPWTLNIDSPEDLILAKTIGSVEGEELTKAGFKE